VLLFIIILSTISAIFTALLETKESFSSNLPISKPYRNQIVFASIGFVLFFLIYFLKDFGVIQIILGLVFIFISFVHLEIISLTKRLTCHISIHFILICTISALSGLDWNEAILGPISFLVLVPSITFFSQKLSNFSGKSRENVNELLELTAAINSIFIFVIGLVIASDRIKFLKKIARWLFN